MEKTVIVDCSKSEVTSKAGKTYTRYIAKYGDNRSLNTISKTYGDYLISHIGKEVEWELKPGRFGPEIVSIAGVELPARMSGGKPRITAEEQARIDQRVKEKDEHIFISVSQNNSPSHIANLYNFPGMLDALEKGNEKAIDTIIKTYLRIVEKMSSGILEQMKLQAGK